jgi:hypothetical protein
MVLEPTKIVEIRMEKQYVIAVKFCFGILFFVSFAVGFELLPPTFLKKWKLKDYSDADLLAFTKKLITKTNAIQNNLQRMII